MRRGPRGSRWDDGKKCRSKVRLQRHMAAVKKKKSETSEKCWRAQGDKCEGKTSTKKKVGKERCKWSEVKKRREEE